MPGTSILFRYKRSLLFPEFVAKIVHYTLSEFVINGVRYNWRKINYLQPIGGNKTLRYKRNFVVSISL